MRDEGQEVGTREALEKVAEAGAERNRERLLMDMVTEIRDQQAGLVLDVAAILRRETEADEGDRFVAFGVKLFGILGIGVVGFLVLQLAILVAVLLK